MSGLGELRERASRLPEELRKLASASPLLGAGALDRIAGIRAVVTTGIGSSRAHAEFLAECLADEAGWPARFSVSGAPAPASSDRDLLVVFSQGLSPNARFALGQVERWGAVVLVTAETPGEPGSARDAAKTVKRAWLEALERLGVIIVAMPAEDEYGTLVRMTGPVAGFAVALELARELAALRGAEPPALAWDPDAVARAFDGAAQKCERSLAGADVVALGEQPIAFVATGGYAQAAQHLATRFSESLWIPRPACWDVLEFAHGPLQEIHDRSATVFFLAREDSQGDPEVIECLRAALVEGRHRLIVWSAEIPGRAAIFEHEALAIAFTLRAMEAAGLDPAKWPGQGADERLYQRTPALPDLAVAKSSPAALPRKLAVATHPEVEAFLRGGARMAVVPLGSTEQHGPHLPFATDTWIAEAVADLYCARRGDAIALPALPVGCAFEHMAFSGTLDLTAETLEAVLCDLLASLARHGFERVLIFSAHGGNAAALDAMRSALECSATPMRIAVHSDLDRLTSVMHGASAAESVGAEAAGHHAGESETSILLSLAPGAVRRARFAPGTVAGSDPQDLFYPSLRDHAPSGVVGDPRPASASRAERYLTAWVDELEGFSSRAFAGDADRPSQSRFE